MGQRNIRDATITIKGAGGKGGTGITMQVGEGNVTWSEKRNLEYIRDRGVILNTREGDDDPVDVSIDAIWDWLIDTTSDDSFREAFTGKTNTNGISSKWTTADDGDECAPYAVNVYVAMDACPAVATPQETIKLEFYRYESFDYDLRAGTLATSGKADSVTIAVGGVS